MTIRDLRWKLAYWTWCPAAWIEEWTLDDCDSRAADDATGPELVHLYTFEAGLPWHLRALRRLVVDPLAWLSDHIYPGWEDDPRALLSYWSRP
jgi:hypothetical protein